MLQTWKRSYDISQYFSRDVTYREMNRIKNAKMSYFLTIDMFMIFGTLFDTLYVVSKDLKKE